MRKRRLAALCVAAGLLAASGCSKPAPLGSWIAVGTGKSDTFYSANFVSDKVGWLNGQSGGSYEPPEGADNSNQSKPKKSGEKAEDPLKANQGFEVLKTTDGGATWQVIPDLFKNKIRSVFFVDPQLGWALTIDRDILQSKDGGLTWSLQRKASAIKLKILGNRRDPVMDQPEQIDHLHFLDARRGWAWGGGRKDNFAEQPGIFLTTLDGGQHWNQINYPFEQTSSCIFFLDGEHAWSSTEDGEFYKTSDGGLNWSKLTGKRPELVFRSIFFTDANNGWVVGRSGRLAKTSDGGRTWKKMFEIKDEFKMRDIFFTDARHGWAAGENGAILYTPDAGETWTNVASPIPSQFLAISFGPDHTGWIVGLTGTVLKYVPGHA